MYVIHCGKIMTNYNVSDCVIHFICRILNDTVRISHSVASEITMTVNDE